MWNLKQIEFSRLERVAAAVCGVVLALALCGLSLAPGWGAKGAIHGRVVAAGEGVEGATVILWARSSASTDSGAERIAQAVTGPTGRFAFSEVAAGDYSLAAEKSGEGAELTTTTEGLLCRVERANVTSVTLKAK